MFHHRFSTSTADVPNACHPFSTKQFFKNNYVGVHNGVIYNDNELEKEHLALGINYVSRQPHGEFNDSEALIYDIARYLEGETTELSAEGSIAFIIIKRNEDGKATTLFFGRNAGNPLKIKRTKHSLTISSEGEGDETKVNTLYSYDYETGELSERYMYIPYYKSTSFTPTSYTYTGYESGYTRDDLGEEYEEDSEDYAADWVGYGQYLTKEARTIINDTEWTPRAGTQTAVRHSILQEAMGDYEKGAIIALIEVEEADKEESRVNQALYNHMSNKSYECLSDYWYYVNAYRNSMADIAADLEKTSIVSTIIAENRQETLVFPSGIEVTEDERSLLPAAV